MDQNEVEGALNTALQLLQRANHEVVQLSGKLAAAMAQLAGLQKQIADLKNDGVDRSI